MSQRPSHPQSAYDLDDLTGLRPRLRAMDARPQHHIFHQPRVPLDLAAEILGTYPGRLWDMMTSGRLSERLPMSIVREADGNRFIGVPVADLCRLLARGGVH